MRMLDKVLSLLDARRISQQDAEISCGMPRGRISKWVGGQGEPTARQALRLAELLRVPVRYLIDDAMTSPEPDVSEIQQRILWLAEAVGYDVAVKRLANALETTTPPPSANGKTRAVDVPNRDADGNLIEPAPRGRKRRA
jgi:transcriptional regulator with XRE-family HTH domain